METNSSQSAFTLGLEQEFKLQLFCDHIKQLSVEEKTDLLIEAMRQLMVKNNVIRHLVVPGISKKNSQAHSVTDGAF